MFSRTVPSKRKTSWLTRPITPRSSVNDSSRTSVPSTVTRPRRRVVEPSSSLTIVLLPAPVRPTTACVSPAGTSMSRPRSTSDPDEYAKRTSSKRTAPAAGRGGARSPSIDLRGAPPAGRGSAASRPSPAGRGRRSRPGVVSGHSSRWVMNTSTEKKPDLAGSRRSPRARRPAGSS